MSDFNKLDKLEYFLETTEELKQINLKISYNKSLNIENYKTIYDMFIENLNFFQFKTMHKKPIINYEIFLNKIKNLEQNIKNFFIDQIKQNFKEIENCWSEIKKFNLNQKNYSVIISKMELGKFLELLLSLHKENFLNNKIFSAKNAKFLLKNYFLNINKSKISWMTKDWDIVFEFLIIFISFRNTIFHFNTWSWGKLETTINLVTFYNKFQLHKKEMVIKIYKPLNSKWEIKFQDKNILETVNYVYDLLINS